MQGLVWSLMLAIALGLTPRPAFGGCVGSPWPIDTFDDGIIGPQWQVIANCGTVAETDGWALLTKNSGCVGYAYIRWPASDSGNAICGDFDIRVDFDITGWPAASTHGGRFNPLLIRRADTGALLAGVERYRESPNTCIPFGDSYKMYTNNPGCQDVANYIQTSDLSGRFRLVREGTTIRGFYWAGTDWVQGMTRTVPSVDVYLELNTGTNGTVTDGHTSRFDNLYVVSPLGVTGVEDPVDNDFVDALRLEQNRPNPFNPKTTIRFDLPVAGQAQLSIYDLAGRLVRVLVEGEISAGSHEAVWDGRDQSGRSAPSGSYLARLVAGGKVEGVRLSLVR